MESQPPPPRVVDPEGFPALQRFTLYETAAVSATRACTSSSTSGSQLHPAASHNASRRLSLTLSLPLLQNLVIVGSDKARTQFRILIIDRSAVYSLQLVEDPYVYPRACIVSRLRQLLERGGGPLESHFAFHALVGFLPLPKLHLVLVTKKHKVGSVANRWIYGISDWTLFPLAHRSYAVGKGSEAAAAGGAAGPRRGESSRYRELVTSHIDLSKDFYFSFFYDVTHSLQYNCAATAAAAAAARNSNAAAASPVPPQPQPAQLSVYPADSENDQQNGSSGGLTKSVSTPLFPSRQPPSWSPSTSALSESIFSSASAASEASTDTAAALPVSPSRSPSPAIGSSLSKSNSSSAFVSSNPWADLDSSFAAAANAPPAAAVTVSKIDSSAPSSSPASLSPASRDLAASFPVSSPSASSSTQGNAPFLPALPPRSHLYNDQWLWNYYLTSAFLRELPHASYWLVPLVHGFFQQQLLRCGNADLLVTLLARRSRHFAGTRYIRRGINALGHVANEVETEQLVESVDNRSAWYSTGASFSSVVLLRGSIPLFWSQENVLSMKPNIVVQQEQDGLIPTRLHFDRLLLRYGPRIDVLSLIKKEERTPQETRLGLAYTAAIAWLQERWKEETGAELQYQTYDFISMRAAKANVLRDVRSLVSPAVQLHGVFSFVTVIEREDEQDRGGREVSSASDLLLRERRTVRETRQTGVIRVNCVDCLDRTNVAQFCIAKAAMKLQLQHLGLLGRSQGDSKVWPELLQVMQSMFTLHGDRIAQQYAGSGAMHRDALYDREKEEDESKDVSDLLSGGVGQATRDRLTQEAVQDAAAAPSGSGGESGKAGGGGGGKGVKAGAGMAHNAISFAKRYYSNNVTDVEKQQAINVFLGHYLPSPAGRRGQQVWDLDAAQPIAEFDQQRGGRGNDFFFLPYNPNVLSDLQLGKKRRGAVPVSPDSNAAADAQHDALRRRFGQFFEEKYNPAKLTSLEKELAKPFVKPVYVGQQAMLADPTTQRLMPLALPPLSASAASVRNGAQRGRAGGDSVEASPVSVSASSSAASVPPLHLAQDDGESHTPQPPLSPSSARGAAELSKSPLPAHTQYDTPPHTPSPHSITRHHSMDLPSPAHAHSSAPPSPAPPQAVSPSAVAADPFAFSLSAGVINAPHPGHRTGLAQANAVANKVGAATKSLFSKMDKGLKTAFGGHRAAVEKPLLHRVRSAGNVHGDAMEQTAGVEAARAGSAALAMPVAQLALSRSQDFHFLDAQAASLVAAAQPQQPFSASGPLSPTSNISPRKSGLPPPHGNASSSSVASRPVSTQAAAAKEVSSGLTRLDDLMAEAREQPAYHSRESPRHQQAVNALRTQQPQQQNGSEQAADEAERPQAAPVSSPPLSSYEDRFLTPRNDDEIFAAYLNTARLYSPVDCNIPWSETFRAQMITDDSRAALRRQQDTAGSKQQQQQQQRQQQPSSPPLLSWPPAASTSVLPATSVAAQLRSEADGEVNLVTSTLPVTGASSAAANVELEKATGSDPLAASTEVPGSSDEAAVAKLAGELH